jgi:RimJ/RimL family protein N-acetyltransferase
MMGEIVLRPLAEADVSTLEAWLEDPDVRRRLGGALPVREWCEFVADEPDYYALMAWDRDSPVGFAAFEVYEDRWATMFHLVGLQFRNRGYGKAILRAVLALPEVERLEWVEASVEPDNEASIRCYRWAGFEQPSPEPDQEGSLTFRHCGRALNPA